MELVEGDVGATAWRKHGHPLPEATLQTARECDAILFGPVGDFECDNLERHLRPEQSILGLRKALGLFANLRPAKMFPGMEGFSGLRPELARTIDMLIARELSAAVPGCAGWPLTTTGHPAASAEAVSPPATEKASGKLDAPNTATGPSGTSASRKSGFGPAALPGSARSIRTRA